MTRYTTTDVLICGAGVTGLTLAIELARHGVSFRLTLRVSPRPYLCLFLLSFVLASLMR